MYILPAFTSIHTPKTPLAVNFNRKYFFFEQGLSIFGFSFLLNFLWEALHAVYLYQRHDIDASNYVPMLLCLVRG